jgi:hypothetical protein
MSTDQSIRSETAGDFNNPYGLYDFIKPSREIFGAGVPLDSIGQNEWSYVDTSTGIQYSKLNGTWSPVADWSAIISTPVGPIDVLEVNTIQGNATDNIQIDLQTAGVLSIGPTLALATTQIQSDGTITTQSGTASIGVQDLAGEQMILGPSYLIKAGANDLIINSASQGLSAQANTTLDLLCGTAMNISAPDGCTFFSTANGFIVTEGAGNSTTITSTSITQTGLGDITISGANTVNVDSGSGQIILTAGAGAVIIDPINNLVTNSIFQAGTLTLTTIGAGADITTSAGGAVVVNATDGYTASSTTSSQTATSGNMSLTTSVGDIVLNSASTITISAGPVRNDAGSAGAPSYSFTSDTNSGVYSVGADVVGVSAGGSVRLSVGTATSTLATHFVPDANNTYDLGTGAIGWRNIYSNNLLNVISDARQKKEVEDLGYGLSFVESLRPVKYKLIDQQDEVKHMGFIAQEVEEALIKVGAYREEFDIVQEREGRYSMKYDSLISCLVNCVKELSQRVKVLEGH